MPKRRMTPARRAAIVKWQRAGAMAKADKAGKRVKPSVLQRLSSSDSYNDKPWAKTRTLPKPVGKNVTLYHRTSMREAKTLVTKGFKHKRNVDTKDVYFSDKLFNSQAKSFGPAAVSVRIRSQLINKRNIAQLGFKYARKDEGWKWKMGVPPEAHYQVDSKYLKGVKVKRVSTVPPSKRKRKK